MRKQNLLIFVYITVLMILGGFFRLYNITANPPSLNIDEVSVGYNAYSILKTGRDEYGVLMPLTFKSTGDYKNPVPVYLMVPAIAIFGLNEFGVRFTTALIAILSIPIFYLFFSKLTKSTKLSLVATTLLTISPWHIFYSRFASDHLIGTTLAVLGAYFFLKMLEDGKIWGFLSALILILSMYTYHPERLFTPLLVLTLSLLNYKALVCRKKEAGVFIFTALILGLPLVYSTFLGPNNTRAEMVFIGNDIEYKRYVLLDYVGKSGLLSFFSSGKFLLFFFWIKRFLNYLQPSFLFFNGLNMTTTGSYGLGVLYLFEIPFFLLGIFHIVKDNFRYKKLVILWILIGILPASLTNNEQSAGRSLLVLPMTLLISSLGATGFYSLVKKIKQNYLRLSVISFAIIFIIWNLVQAFLIFAVHFPKQRGEAYMEGTKQSVEYALAHKSEYKEIVFDPYRGIEAPYIVNIPHMYILFYSQYDPLTYQNETKIIAPEYYHFDKFTVRHIDWHSDDKQKGVLFIGSPWSLPLKDIKQDDVLAKFYLSGGPLSLVAVSPH